MPDLLKRQYLSSPCWKYTDEGFRDCRRFISSQSSSNIEAANECGVFEVCPNWCLVIEFYILPCSIRWDELTFNSFTNQAPQLTMSVTLNKWDGVFLVSDDWCYFNFFICRPALHSCKYLSVCGSSCHTNDAICLVFDSRVRLTLNEAIWWWTCDWFERLGFPHN